ncbi:MAG: hypothetical protein VXW37_05610, partial [Candidatus Thermoplasmatota archaeon]|nr:hypothetical protein [Candidatus Thermoplasmatota archaeon]
AAAEWRSNKLTSSEYDETTWSARTWLTFVAQRLSVAVQLSVAQEAAEALGAIGDRVAMTTLERFVSDPEPVISESCEVAIDLLEYVASKSLDYGATE